MAELSEALLSVLPSIRVPKAGDRVHKDECAFSFDTPKEEDANSSAGDPPRKKPTRLAIGVEGGFDITEEKFEYDEDVKIVIFPEHLDIPRDGLEGLPDMVRDRIASAVEAILTADSASRKQEVQAWDGEVRRVSKHAFSLHQLQNDVRIPPCGWKCSKCDMRENLWLNMTDGAILCGRRYFDGSGGNNHAVEHYRETGYPLAVKLGTITPDGADVYSYDEDDMVLDPNLAEHLAHFGIDMLKMQKTDKTMTELEIDMNQRIGEWELIQESGVQLKPLYGPGYTGIRNLGNSCYLNSVMQVLFSIPDFQRKYVDKLEKIFQSAPSDPTQDFSTQVAKLGHGLLSGEYSKPASADGEQQPDQKGMQNGIAPRMFKSLIGKGHPEFSTNRQQDAQEFFLHFINMVERNCRSSENPNEVFRFLVEEKLKCLATEKVKYTQRVDYIMQLPVPMDAALNKDELLEYEEKKRQAEEEKQPLPELVRAKVPFSSCLEAYGAPEQVDDFWSTALQAKSVALKTTRFASFPDYLVIQIKKFTFGLDWVPKKLDVSIEMPEELDISALQGTGLQDGEEEMPDIAPPLVTPDEPKAPMLDESVIIQLVEMGFPMDACRKAVYYTGNSGVEAAMNWVMSHMDDPDFANPLVLPGSSGPGSTIACPDPPSEDSVATIVSMGFSRDQAMKALRATNNSLERAVDWIFSHIDDLDAEAAMDISEGRSAAESISESVPVGPKVRDGPGKYQLFAFISHMGTSTMCGHYVCHIKKDGRWVIYNDQKVCASEKPPKDLGYIYFYQRIPS
ncbi:ubiquitin carboxyl-terminal hydrolase 5 isoform X5 [Gavia stellata]|uniref:ubiquitin carboxyl-terminal hydrolase 5 isoform X5 n=1 Tax=Gavia stellata TaxID=37040 RepID=UPI00289789EE|nr:ubiquitin carboxyl-terminal hydrolase 5 isoform X5 [Gavia stellata]